MNDDFVAEMSTSILEEDLSSIKRLSSRLNPPATESLGGWVLLAASEGRCKSLMCLIELGANVNHSNSAGETPFSYACARNYFDVATILHREGANINTLDESGATPLDWAVCHASYEFRDWLKKVGGRRNLSYDEWDYPKT